jgi:hypothetical protein
MTYTAAQYRDQERTMQIARWATATGLCPVCRTAPSATWPDGARRITCGADACYLRWLNIRPPTASIPSTTDQFPVTIAGVTDHA